MDSENKNKSFHWFNLVAFKDQVSGSHLPDVHEKTLDDFPISAFLPAKKDLLHLKEALLAGCIRSSHLVLNRFTLTSKVPPPVGLEPTTFELEVQHASPLRHGG